MYRLSLIFILCFCFAGCNQPSGSIPAKTGGGIPAAPNPLQKLNMQYDQLQEKRLALQNKIEQAFIFYTEYTENTKQQKEQLKKNLGDVPFEEAVEIFISNKNIPSNLRLASSCWRSLLPDEVQRQKIFEWLENQQKSDLLVELEVKMKTIDNYRKVGTFLNEADQKDVDRLLVAEVGDWSETRNDWDYEQKAVESLKNELMK
ncbi:MAG: hypothetical protein FWE67_15355 [Planctomycetaceae bacterium]|nr:hypothetical protein [Planctomycetaceae bacterium]